MIIVDNNLILQHTGYIKKMASSFSSDRDERKDFEQEGYLGLMQAAQSYDPNKGTKFLTYAHKWINGKMKAHLIRNIKAKGMTGRHETLLKSPPVFSKTEADLYNVAERDSSAEQRVQQVSQVFVQDFALSLKKQEKKFFHRRFIQELSHKRLSALYRISEKAVKHREQNHKRWLEKFAKVRPEIKEYLHAA